MRVLRGLVAVGLRRSSKGVDRVLDLINETLVTPAEVQEWLGVSRTTVDSWFASGLEWRKVGGKGFHVAGSCRPILHRSRTPRDNVPSQARAIDD